MGSYSPLRFPVALAPRFSVEELEQSPSTIVVVDRLGQILWVNAAWWRFAEENGGAVEAWVPRCYYDGITQPLRDYYREAFADALETATVFTQEYDCSSVETHRLYHLRALPIDRSWLILEHSLRISRSLDEHPEGEREEALIETYRTEAGLILQCGNCRRVKHPDSQAWNFVSALVAKVDARTSHCICTSCIGFYWRRPQGRRTGAK